MPAVETAAAGSELAFPLSCSSADAATTTDGFSAERFRFLSSLGRLSTDSSDELGTRFRDSVLGAVDLVGDDGERDLGGRPRFRGTDVDTDRLGGRPRFLPPVVLGRPRGLFEPLAEPLLLPVEWLSLSFLPAVTRDELRRGVSPPPWSLPLLGRAFGVAAVACRMRELTRAARFSWAAWHDGQNHLSELGTLVSGGSKQNVWYSSLHISQISSFACDCLPKHTRHAQKQQTYSTQAPHPVRTDANGECCA